MEQTARTPYDELDFASMSLNPSWGREATHELNEKLSFMQEVKRKAKEGEELTVEEKREFLWGLLTFYTRDIRLGNLKDAEMNYCQWYIDFAGDCLEKGFIRSFMTSLRRAITRIELSQSRRGFRTKEGNTIRKEESFSTDPKKKKLFGKPKED